VGGKPDPHGYLKTSHQIQYGGDSRLYVDH
jgi:hypothetical protein